MLKNKINKSFFVVLVFFGLSSFVMAIEKDIDNSGHIENEFKKEEVKLVEEEPEKEEFSKLIKVTEAKIETDGSSGDIFYSKIYYDEYGRVYKVEDFFPFGYRGVVDYKYYDYKTKFKFDENREYWISSLKKESGYIKNFDGEKIANYTLTYNDRQEVSDYKSNGIYRIKFIFDSIAKLIGVDSPTEEELKSKSLMEELKEQS